MKRLIKGSNELVWPLICGVITTTHPYRPLVGKVAILQRLVIILLIYLLTRDSQIVGKKKVRGNNGTKKTIQKI